MNKNWLVRALSVKYMDKCFSELEFKELEESGLHVV